MTDPQFSVIIPAYNAERTLPDAVASVQRQAMGPLDIIIVDDGSTDGTRSCCERLGASVRYVHQQNTGVAGARNRGLEEAPGRFVAFLDADDEWPLGSLSLLYAALDAHPEWIGVQGRTAAYISIDGTMEHDDIVGAPWFGPTLGSALFRRAAFEQVGHFDPILSVAEDLDWFIRAREMRCAIGQIPGVTLRYRLHAGSLTRGLDPQNKNLMVVLKRSLERRRASASQRAAV